MAEMINQHHEGSGDNVNNKIINIITSLKAGNLGTFVEEVLRDINFRSINLASEKILIIKTIDDIDASVKALLDVLEVKIRLAQDKPNKISDNHRLRNVIKNPDYPNMLIKLARSVFIELLSFIDDNAARDEFNEIGIDDSIYNEVFFHRIATKNELSSLSTQLSRRTEGELIALIRGALRLESIDIAYQVSNYLNAVMQTPYSEFLRFHIDVVLLSNRVLEKHVFHYKSYEIKEIDDYVSKLLNIFHSNPSKYSIPLINLISATHMNESRLVKLAVENIEYVREHNSDFANYIIAATEEYYVPEDIRMLKGLEIDLNGFSDLLFALDKGIVSIQRIKEWILDGGHVVSENEYFSKISNLLLDLWVVKSDDNLEVLRISKKAEELIYEKLENSSELNPAFILRVSESLLCTELPILALKFIEPFILEGMWISPLYETYLQALYLSEKNSEFFKRINTIPLSDKTEFLLSLETQACISYLLFHRAVECASKLIELNDTSPHNWYLFLLSHRLNKTDLKIIKNMVYKIPPKVLSTYSENKRQLIVEIAVNVDTQLSDKILIDWFIQEPVKGSRLLIDVHMQTIDKRNYNKDELNITYPSDLCVKGVVFTDGFDTFKKIVVNNHASKHAQFVDASTPLGKALCSMSVGEKRTISGSNQITLQEEITPYLAVYQLALNIRNNSNDGSDSFRLFTLPEKQDDLIPYLTRVIGKYSTNISELDHFLLNPELPLFMKGHHAFPENPAKAMHNLLTYDKLCSLITLYNNGLVDQKEIILDGYTIHYFGQLGLLSIIVSSGYKIYISSATNLTLKKWLSESLKNNFMSLAVTERGLKRLTSEDIKSEQFDYIREIHDFLNHCITIPLIVFDMPDEIVKLRDIVDNTIYSTLQIAIANKIPWACLDNYVSQLVSSLKVDVVNFNSMLNALSQQCNSIQKARLVRAHITWGLPVNLNYNDLFYLSNNDLDVYVLTRFLHKYGVKLNSHEAVFDYVFDLISPIIFKGMLEKKIPKGGHTYNASYVGHEEYLFNVVCDIIINLSNGKSAEANLAYFIFLFYSRAFYLPKIVELISMLASFYASGHFLDYNEINFQLHRLIVADNESRR